jgi:hypothetical protein
MESSGWAVMGAFTGDTEVNELKKGRRRPGSGARRLVSRVTILELFCLI